MRGASKDVLNEVERNLHDAMGVARNVVRDPRLVPGGGACEMAVSRRLKDRSAAIEGAYLPLGAVQVLICLSAAACAPHAARQRASHVNGPHGSRGTDAAGVEQWPYKAVGVALEVIPRTLAQNCGANVIR